MVKVLTKQTLEIQLQKKTMKLTSKAFENWSYKKVLSEHENISLYIEASIYGGCLVSYFIVKSQTEIKSYTSLNLAIEQYNRLLKQ